MSNDETKVLAAERSGRALAATHNPEKGDLWRVECAPGAAAWLAAARWAHLLGATVERRDAAVNRIVIRKNGRDAEVRALPPPDAALAMSLAEARRFVAPIDAASPRLSRAACRAIDGRAVAVLGIPGICLMENASLAALAVLGDMAAALPKPFRTLIAVGGGNNGGDGLALARMLLEKGMSVEVALLKPPESLTGDAAINLRLLRAVPGAVLHGLHNHPSALAAMAEESHLLVDALLGTGFSGAVSPVFEQAIACLNHSGKPVLALDLPSGLESDDGTAAGAVVLATRTVTFAAVKTGLERNDGPRCAGKIYLGSIGAPILPA